MQTERIFTICKDGKMSIHGRTIGCDGKDELRQHAKRDPTPEEIAAECAAIRAEWPEHRLQRNEIEPPVEMPTIQTGKRRNGEML